MPDGDPALLRSVEGETGTYGYRSRSAVNFLTARRRLMC